MFFLHVLHVSACTQAETCSMNVMAFFEWKHTCVVFFGIYLLINTTRWLPLRLLTSCWYWIANYVTSFHSLVYPFLFIRIHFIFYWTYVWSRCFSFSPRRRCRFLSSGIWSRVTGLLVPDSWRWDNCFVSKRREPTIQWRGVISLKNGNLICIILF